MKINCFKNEVFELYKKGVYDNDNINVNVNADFSFAFLDPIPEIDYDKYITRNEKLGLQKNINKTATSKQRFSKINKYLKSDSVILEIGAADGFFLKYIQSKKPEVRLYAVETDLSTLEARNNINGLVSYNNIEDLINEGIIFDLVLMHHVLEHIVNPDFLLSQIKDLMGENSQLIIEVPSLDDPLRKLYNIEEYENFFFQSQHPYYYSAISLKKLMTHNDFHILDLIFFQRYGIDNHLNWLLFKRPGLFNRLFFETINEEYKKELEKNKFADTIIIIIKKNKKND